MQKSICNNSLCIIELLCFDIRACAQKGKDMDIQIIEFPATKIACIHHIGPYKNTRPIWDKLCRWADSNHLLSPATTFLGICHDDPERTEPSKIRYDACVSLNQEISSANDGVEIKTIEARKYIKAIHIGSCLDMKKAYRYIFEEWMPANGKKAVGDPCMEVYKNDPDTTPDHEFVTEIYVPFKE